MKHLIQTRTGFYSIEKAHEVAAQLTAGEGEGGWTYPVTDCGNGYGRIDVVDEDGEVIEKGFIY